MPAPAAAGANGDGAAPCSGSASREALFWQLAGLPPAAGYTETISQVALPCCHMLCRAIMEWQAGSAPCASGPAAGEGISLPCVTDAGHADVLRVTAGDGTCRGLGCAAAGLLCICNSSAGVSGGDERAGL